MKLLAINSFANLDSSKRSAIDYWRIHSPLEELKKHVDWQIDYLPTFLPGADEFTSPDQFDKIALDKAAEDLGQYDIIFSSYQPSPFVFALLYIVRQRYGTKYILDDDDDVFNMEYDNPAMMKLTTKDIGYMQRMIELSDFICTTTPTLQKMYQAHTKGKVFQIPNYMSQAYKNEAVKSTDRINIGYWGGAGHYNDLHETNILPALERIMHEYKQVHFTTVGIPLDAYLPKGRTHHIDSAAINTWLTAIYPKLNFDIAIAPLRNNLFSESKSNIKWLEATRMNAAFIGSKIGPYRDLEPSTAITVNNTTEDWYDGLKRLIPPANRQKLVQNAKYKVEAHWQLEDNWQKYRDMFEAVQATEI